MALISQQVHGVSGAAWQIIAGHGNDRGILAQNLLAPDGGCVVVLNRAWRLRGRVGSPLPGIAPL